MRLDRTDGFVISDDKALLDIDRVHAWLSTDTYWATGRSRRTVEKSIAGSDAYGVYGPDGAQAAFCRIVTDRATFGYLCDVYVDRAHRGRGIGKWMVGAVRDAYAPLGMRRLLLATLDAHGLYSGAGFVALREPGLWMELPAPVPGAAESVPEADRPAVRLPVDLEEPG
ncbi:MAG TPA: GNAT family N-acetyltransferase [Actinocrinis sp.]|jgi:GNAT superfamily N-acetyltransferase|uniref:GNAT family N-acetyltransferase n=1 Tax=Actinocrinis sp. TaxID=1920516 RepID=UPI002DDDB67B|nr:GNAT family N-acetyltransferase [Actinocrinis sp.]HEV3169480.1 GNAT family N-acetyltransferase [Actinocrinis sp.]